MISRPSSSRRVSRKYSLGDRRVFELVLGSQPVLSIGTVCVPAIDVDLVGALSDVFVRYDHERWRECVINHK
jgi:hypothetical protein